MTQRPITKRILAKAWKLAWIEKADYVCELIERDVEAIYGARSLEAFRRVAAEWTRGRRR